MQTVFIILSVGVIFACIQYSYGAPRRIQSLDSDEIPKYAYKLKPYMNDDLTEELRESSEEEKKKKVFDTNEYIENSDELTSEQNKEDDDTEAMFPNFVDDNREKNPENSDEN